MKWIKKANIRFIGSDSIDHFRSRCVVVESNRMGCEDIAQLVKERSYAALETSSVNSSFLSTYLLWYCTTPYLIATGTTTTVTASSERQSTKFSILLLLLSNIAVSDRSRRRRISASLQQWDRDAIDGIQTGGAVPPTFGRSLSPARSERGREIQSEPP